MSLSHGIKGLHRSVPKRLRHYWQVTSHVPKPRGLPAASAAGYSFDAMGCPFTGHWRERTGNRRLRLCRQLSPSRLCHARYFGLLAANAFGLGGQPSRDVSARLLQGFPNTGQAAAHHGNSAPDRQRTGSLPGAIAPRRDHRELKISDFLKRRTG
jgi:hypothetical protein